MAANVVQTCFGPIKVYEDVISPAAVARITQGIADELDAAAQLTRNTAEMMAQTAQLLRDQAASPLLCDKGLFRQADAQKHTAKAMRAVCEAAQDRMQGTRAELEVE